MAAHKIALNLPLTSSHRHNGSGHTNKQFRPNNRGCTQTKEELQSYKDSTTFSAVYEECTSSLMLGAHVHEGYSAHFECVCLEFAAFISHLYTKYDIPCSLLFACFSWFWFDKKPSLPRKNGFHTCIYMLCKHYFVVYMAPYTRHGQVHSIWSTPLCWVSNNVFVIESTTTV